MARLLLVLRGPLDLQTVRSRWQAASLQEAELAFCYELPAGGNGFAEALLAQREVTEALRQACGPAAESIAVFAVSDRDGDRVEDCARDWGATEVRP